MKKYNVKNFLLISSLIATANLCTPVLADGANISEQPVNELRSIQLSKSSGDIIEVKLLTKKKMASKPLVFDRGKNIYLVSLPNMSFHGDRKIYIDEFEQYLTEVTADFVPYKTIQNGGYTRIIIKTKDNAKINVTNAQDFSIRLSNTNIPNSSLLKIIKLLSACGGILVVVGGALYIYIRQKNKKVLNTILDNSDNVFVEDISGDNTNTVNTDEQNDVLEFLDKNPDITVQEIENIEVNTVDNKVSDEIIETQENDSILTENNQSIPETEQENNYSADTEATENDFTPSADEIVNDILNNDDAVDAISATVMEQINKTQDSNLEEILEENELDDILAENDIEQATVSENIEQVTEENIEPNNAEVSDENAVTDFLEEYNFTQDDEETAENNIMEPEEISKDVEKEETEIAEENEITNFVAEDNIKQEYASEDAEQEEIEIAEENEITNFVAEDNIKQEYASEDAEQEEIEIAEENEITDFVAENNIKQEYVSEDAEQEETEIAEENIQESINNEYTSQSIENTSGGSSFIPNVLNFNFTTNPGNEAAQTDNESLSNDMVEPITTEPAELISDDIVEPIMDEPAEISNQIESEFDIIGFDGILGEIPLDEEIVATNGANGLVKSDDSEYQEDDLAPIDDVELDKTDENINIEYLQEEVTETVDIQQEEIIPQTAETVDNIEVIQPIQEQVIEEVQETVTEDQTETVEPEAFFKDNSDTDNEEVENTETEIHVDTINEKVAQNYPEAEPEEQQQEELIETAEFFKEDNYNNNEQIEKAPGAFFKDTFDYEKENVSESENISYFKEETTVEEIDDSEPLVISQKELSDGKTLYLIRHEGQYSLIGIQNEMVYVLNKFESEPAKTNICIKLNEEADNNLIYIIKIDSWRALISVSDDKMENILTLS